MMRCQVVPESLCSCQSFLGVKYSKVIPQVLFLEQVADATKVLGHWSSSATYLAGYSPRDNSNIRSMALQPTEFYQLFRYGSGLHLLHINFTKRLQVFIWHSMVEQLQLVHAHHPKPIHTSLTFLQEISWEKGSGKVTFHRKRERAASCLRKTSCCIFSTNL